MAFSDEVRSLKEQAAKDEADKKRRQLADAQRATEDWKRQKIEQHWQLARKAASEIQEKVREAAKSNKSEVVVYITDEAHGEYKQSGYALARMFHAETSQPDWYGGGGYYRFVIPDFASVVKDECTKLGLNTKWQFHRSETIPQGGGTKHAYLALIVTL